MNPARTNPEKLPLSLDGVRSALLICNGSFPAISQQLDGPAKDAKLLDTVLSDKERCKFSVLALVDKGLLEVRREIAKICASASKNDTLFIYYSGMGIIGQEGSLHLLVYDSERDYPLATALDAEFILSQLRGSKCRSIVLIIDGCFSGAFFANNRGIPDGLYAITSCGATEYCMDTPEGGAFSIALCAGLRDAAADTDGDGLVSIDELYEFVKQKLLADGHEGTPRKWVWNVENPIFMTANPRQVFLSYARKDFSEADRLAQALEMEGLSVWIDRESINSGNWKDRVSDGISHARAVVVLLTSESYVSKPVRKELNFATKNNIPIIPVQLEKTPESQIPKWFTFDYDELHRHVIEEDQYEVDVKKLAAAIRSLRIC
jgi:hypothetical protein